ncbi:DUF4097 family beta strand repeat-containing protein [Zhihengliuella sp. ISTPL4]|uniref:DUF4097 family beta strand repeat-containing protein n=1 Tax=Zhihengliuella sp. ISTPL4 TaxID=2058657 RepID=UPI00130531E8|nr:DUF4097 family beta strand repeat-containing protein [Zhihengliuella sp. ISTPL4]
MTTENSGAEGGHTPITPPPPQTTSPSAPTPSGPEPGRSPGATAVMIVTAVVGGIALLGAGGTAAVAATGNILSSSRPDSVQTLDVDGLEAIDLDADASMVRVVFADVDAAELSVTNGRESAWTFEREADELVVRSPRPAFGWWFGNWFGDEERVVLTLPEELGGARLDASFTLDAGSLDVAGEFHALEVQVNAGSLDVSGAAESFDVQMNAGRADVLLDGVDQADLGIAAGDLSVELTGDAPTATTIDVSAGSLNLTLPAVEYRITQDVNAGSFDATVDESSSARRTIDVSLAAGSVNIDPGR